MSLAEQHGWHFSTRRVWVASPTTIESVSFLLRLSRPDCPRVWAIWKGHTTQTLRSGWSFWRSFASTAQRLGAGDLLTVLADPTILTDVDPEDPFATAE